MKHLAALIRFLEMVDEAPPKGAWKLTWISGNSTWIIEINGEYGPEFKAEGDVDRVVEVATRWLAGGRFNALAKIGDKKSPID